MQQREDTSVCAENTVDTSDICCSSHQNMGQKENIKVEEVTFVLQTDELCGACLLFFSSLISACGVKDKFHF